MIRMLCTEKTNYPSVVDAKNAIKYYIAVYGNHQRYYFCNICGGIHLASKNKKKYRGKKKK